MKAFIQPIEIHKFIKERWVSMLKWIILLAAFSFLTYKFITFNQYNQFLIHWKSISPSQFWWLIGVLALLPLNWLLEAIKWRKLVSKVQEININNSIKGVLAGISTGFFTPNRVGELVGRVIYLDAEKRKAGVTLSVVNSLSQNLVMTLIGVPACFLYFNRAATKIEINSASYLTVLISCLLILGLVYFKLPQLSRLFKQSRYSEKIKEFTYCLNDFNKQDLFQIMFISLCRFITFSLQFFLMLRFFGVDLTAIQALIAIPTTYLFVTYTPSLAFSEPAVRSSYAVIVMGAFSGQVVGIALAGVCIWLVNFVIPMLIGSVILVRKRA
ncbi:MAG: lysylphosphatidylglycerol synthase domain-containing protein [Paludibacter sp.]|nr:lysylphosphatidylglycerol synthase domain-containing protein [Paludibacter sp.]